MISAQSLINSKVFDRSNKEIGTIKNLMVDLESGELVRADIALHDGGFLGIRGGEQRISVPWDQVSVKRHEGKLVLVMNQEVVEQIRTGQSRQPADQANKNPEKASEPATQRSASRSGQQATPSGKQQERVSADDIRKAEEALQAKGLNPGPVDGKLDNQTQNALREFQKQNNLPVTGSLDSQTAEKLGIKLGQGSGAM